jgi:hypothetical protein
MIAESIERLQNRRLGAQMALNSIPETEENVGRHQHARGYIRGLTDAIEILEQEEI